MQHILGLGNEDAILPGQLEATQTARSERYGSFLFSKFEGDAFNSIAGECGLGQLKHSSLGKKRFIGGDLAEAIAKKRIKLVVFDFDGVLTDNRVLVLENGLEAVLCNRSDGLAFDMLRAAGIPALILSTEANNVVSARARKLKLSVLQGKKDKKAALISHCSQQEIELDEVLYVGNDLNDLGAMGCVGFPVCTKDAHPEVRRISKWVLKKKGGDGVARELAEDLLGLIFVGE